MYITAKNIKRKGIDLSNVTYVGEEVHREIYRRCNPQKGDILYIKDGATCGISTINDLDDEFSLLSSVALIKPNRNIFNSYLNIYLQSEFCYRNVRRSMKGVGITRIILKQMELWEIPIPPYEEQKRIVREAEYLLCFTEEIEKGQTDIYDYVLRTKVKILDLAIHGKLVPQDPLDEPSINILRRINPSFRPSYNLHYEGYPSGWQVVILGDIISLYSGRDLEAAFCNAEHRGIPYLVGASCVEGNSISVYRWTECPEVIAKRDDVLLSCKGTIGEVLLNSIGDVHIARQFMAIRSKAPQLILPKYIELIIKASIMKLKSAARGIIPGLSREDILEMRAVIPPLAEQKRILMRINEIEDSLSQISQGISD